ncbi:MAG: ABC transporter permease [Pirellulaceae bacterium]
MSNDSANSSYASGSMDDSRPRRNATGRSREIIEWSIRAALGVGVFLAFLVLWQVVVAVRDLAPIFLPSPARVASAAWEERGKLAAGFTVTGSAAALGLLLSIVLGTLLAVLFSQSRWVRSAFYPYVIFLQTVPIVAITPLLITWFGYGFKTVVIVATIISIFPIVSNVTAGLISVDENMKDLFRLNHATRWQTLIKLRIPHSISHLILGTRVSAGLAVIGAIVGEFFVGTQAQGFVGLGTLMTAWQRLARTDASIAVVFASTLLGLLMLTTVNALAWTILRRWTGEFERG